MTSNNTLRVKDFFVAPGSRKKIEGRNSGEEFREILEPVFKDFVAHQRKLKINLDGTIGYATSWLEEVFGGLARKYGKEKVLEILDFTSEEEPYLIEDIKAYIENAKK